MIYYRLLVPCVFFGPDLPAGSNPKDRERTFLAGTLVYCAEESFCIYILSNPEWRRWDNITRLARPASALELLAEQAE